VSNEGYYPSPWPAEDGGPARLQVPQSRCVPLLGAGKRLRITRRRVHFPTMTVLREPGEVYLLRHEMLRHRFFGLPTRAWVERLDPLTLQPLTCSPALPGGPAWPGGMAAHRNGDLHVVYGRWCHRLAPDCSLRASLQLPRKRPYNSFVILDDGTLVTKDFSDRGDSALVCIDPDTLRIIGAPLPCPEPSIARLSATGNAVYVVGTKTVFRYRWDPERRRLARDPDWAFPYIDNPAQGYGWDPVIDGEDCWFMDNGRHRYFLSMLGAGVGRGVVNLLRVSLSDATDCARYPVSGLPGGAITNPPLIDRSRGIAVAYDSAHAVLRAWRILPGARALEPLWEKRGFGAASHLLLLPQSGELLVNDYRALGEDLVVLDIATGDERGRTGTGGHTQGVVFPGVGWNDDLYYCSFDSLLRVQGE